MSLRIALLQTDIVFGDPEGNKKKMEQYFKYINSDVDIVVLPELWTTGYDLNRLDEIADTNAQDSIAFLTQLAKHYHVNIVGGSVAKRTPEGVTNTMLVINRKGEFVSEYEKAHLFRLMNEEKFLIEGNHTGLFTLENEPSAGVICYDIRFPEWIRTNMVDGAKMLFVVAQWPLVRIDHWKTLLTARAIENQCYVIACNRVGEDPNNTFGGHSMFINPWGEVIREASTEEEMLRCSINLTDVDNIRKTIPVFDDRRPDIYQ
ncbi:2-oxoglutaramate amidase [Paraliobacillus sp. PM-2]|uniref:carbon-nitrogen family hydrolase n=1 Tax=Paraliobacillus sp. PM-2 TaxID=1462524 RepID=UPI00061C2660|nr:carbon-nitrogen family hydrolase [Paraliobacillus sp. PM-2]CQR48329.1 2-oxoglutaramate amidase [Paraliobacillus sp. PM-2]